MGALHDDGSVAELHEAVRAVLDRVNALAVTVTPRGGLAAYGAGCTAWNLLISEARKGAAYDTIMDGAVAYARSSHVPTEQLPPFMIAHFVKRRGTVAEW
jgi:hypothetical protein